MKEEESSQASMCLSLVGAPRRFDVDYDRMDT